MKPGILTRRTPLRRSRGTTWPTYVANEIEARDEWRCIGPRIGMPRRCIGSTQKDHVRASGALGKKSRSTLDNGCLLCALHHDMKTSDGPRWRPAMIAWIDQHAAIAAAIVARAGE